MAITTVTRHLLCLLSFLGAAASLVGEWDVRLANGATENVGRLEAHYNGTWRGVCSNGFRSADADVVCAQLGYERGASVVQRQAQLFYGSLPDVVTCNFTCLGKETDLSDCPGSAGYGSTLDRCTDIVGIQCLLDQPQKPSTLPIRLSCPLRNALNGTCKACPDQRAPAPKQCAAVQPAVEGIVQVYYGGQWRSIASKMWNMKDANVVCGELGYPLALGIPTMQELWPNFDGSVCSASSANRTAACDSVTVAENNQFREGLRSVYLQTVKCTGAETRLLDCYFSAIGPASNPSLSVATVRCGFQPPPACTNETIRLRGGAVPWTGRVEVKLNGQWGTICDSGWDIRDATVVCRSLGYGSATAAIPSAPYGRGVGRIQLTNARCTGTEASLAMCTYQSGLVAASCGHSRDAGVICNAPSAACFKTGSRFITASDANSLNQSRSFLQLNGPSGWGLVCYTSVAGGAVPAVACREARGAFAYSVQKGTVSSYQGVRYVGAVSCQGNELSLAACTQRLFSISRCPDGDTVVTCTTGLPDLVPDTTALLNSLLHYPYIDSIPLYSITCGLDDNCLASSAKTKSPTDYVKVLRFSTQVMNWGTYDFVPSLPPYLWIWHACHNHYHSIEALSNYTLYNASTGLKVAEGRKASFCLEDTICSQDGGQQRYSCNLNTQGISPNCGDLYASHLDCQWIDVSDVQPGGYVLELLINPGNSMMESDYSNNAARCNIKITSSNYFTVSSCYLSDH